MTVFEVMECGLTLSTFVLMLLSYIESRNK